MRDPERIPRMLETIGKFWEKHPDLRLGQLMVLMAQYGVEDAKKDSCRSVFYVEDDELIRRLESMKAEQALRRTCRYVYPQDEKTKKSIEGVVDTISRVLK